MRRKRTQDEIELNLSTYAVRADKWDHGIAAATHDEDEEFASEGRMLGRTVDTATELWMDTFFEFYKAEPDLLEDKEIQPKHRVDRAIMQHMAEVPAYEELREYSMGDPFAAAAACVSVRPTLEAINDRLKVAKQRAQRIQQMYEEQAKLMAQQAAEQEDGDGDGGEGGDIQAQIDALQEQIASEEQQMGQEVAAEAGVIRHQFSESLQEAVQEAEAFDMVRGLMPGQKAGKGEGKLTPMSYAQRKALAQLLNNEKVEKAFELVGAMTKSLKSMNRERVTEGVEEIVDIDLGSDLMQVVLSEFVMLKHPAAKLKFMKDFHGDNLQVYETLGHEPVENGDIICCIDGSGSMSGQPDIWAKAVGMVLLHIARTQKRGFRGILFTTSTWEYDFTDEKAFTPERVASFIRDFPNGGTSFMAPLDVARGWIKDDIAKTGRTSADIIFITDGQCHVDPAWLEQWKQDQITMDFKTWGVMIGGSGPGYYGDVLGEICDGRTMNAKDMQSGKDLDLLWKNI